MPWLNKPSPEQTARLYKCLTAGSDLAVDVAKSQQHLHPLIPVQPKIQPAPIVRPKVFNVSDKSLLVRLDSKKKEETKSKRKEAKLIEGLPPAGSIFCGFKCRGVNNHIKKELKDTGYKYDLISKLKDADLEVNPDLEDIEITRAGKNFILENTAPPPPPPLEEKPVTMETPQGPDMLATGVKVPPLMIRTSTRKGGRKGNEEQDSSFHEPAVPAAAVATATVSHPPTPVTISKKETKNERIGRVANEIVANWEKIREAVDGFKVDHTCTCL